MASDPYRSAWHFRQMRRAMAWTGIIAGALAGLSMVVIPIPSVRPFTAGALFVVVAVGGGIVGYHAVQR